MKTIRAILTGTVVWILGVSVFISSYYIILIEDPELQSNIALALAIIPFAWLGARNYYSKYHITSGHKLAFIMVTTAVILDGLLTVPVLIIPNGGSYMDFYGSPSFWLIALEYYLVVFLFWQLKIKAGYKQSINQ